MDALLKNEIFIDSSICPGLYNKHRISAFDFRSYPQKIKYSFDSTPKIIAEEGAFTEIPITTVKLSIIKNVYHKLLSRTKYSSFKNEKRGGGVADIYNDKLKIKKLFSALFLPQRGQFTTDSNFSEKFNSMLKKVPKYATMILHPKLINGHTLEILEGYVSTNKIRFISIQDFLTYKVRNE
jgi:hypothetical protein